MPCFQAFINDFKFVWVVFKVLTQACLIEFNAFHSEVLTRQLLHFLLNGFEVALGNGFHRKIIVKAAVDGWTDGGQGIRIQFHHRLSQQVSG